MSLISQMKECPHLAVAFQNNMSATTAVATVRTTLWDEFLPSEMGGARSSFAGAAIDLYIINEVRSGHIQVIIKM
jgi:hypothetical protein